MLEIAVQDSQLTGRPAVGRVSVPLSRIPEDGRMTAWLPVQVRLLSRCAHSWKLEQNWLSESCCG